MERFCIRGYSLNFRKIVADLVHCIQTSDVFMTRVRVRVLRVECVMVGVFKDSITEKTNSLRRMEKKELDGEDS